MHFTKRLTAAAALLALLFTLCSCIDMEMGIIINSDGTARAYTEIAIQKSILEMAGKTEEEFFEQVDESEGSEKLRDWKMEKFSKTVGGEAYTGVRYFNDTTYDVLAQEGLSGNGENGKISFERENGSLLVTMVYEGDAAEPSGEMESYLSQNMMNVLFRVKAPFPILETNGTIDEDGSVFWNMLDVMTGKTDRLEMTVRYDAGPDIGMILLIAGGALLLIVVIAVILIAVRKKPKPLAAAASYAPAPIPAEMSVPVEVPVPVEVSAPVETPVEPIGSAKTEEKKFCTDCGAQIKADDTFCPGCGSKIQ